MYGIGGATRSAYSFQENNGSWKENMSEKCSVEGCERPVSEKGFCNAHYLRHLRYGDPLKGGPMRKTKPPKVCSVAGCGRAAYCHGYCGKHGANLKNHGTPIVHRKKRRPCKISGCGELAVAKGLCRRHYGRMYRNEVLDVFKDMSGLSKKYPEEYKTLLGVRKRCSNPKEPSYPNYGGRGIKVCKRWQGPDGFKNFLEDMGPRPGPGYSIDRIDVNGDYTPENCRWATREQQSNNRRNNILITKDGVTHTLAEWARILKIDYWTLHNRYRRHGAVKSILWNKKKK